MRDFNKWVEEQLTARNWPKATLKRAGVPQGNLYKGLSTNEWLLVDAIIIGRVFGINWENYEDIKNSGFHVAKWSKVGIRNPRLPAVVENPETSLEKALDAIHGESDSEKKEELLRVALRTISAEKKSFLAVIATIIPTPMRDDRKHYRLLREALYNAHDQGLMVLFIAPSEAKVKQWSEDCGFSVQDSASAHLDRYITYKRGYIEHLKKKALIDESRIPDEVEMRMNFIQEDVLDAAGWLYIVCLVGEESLGELGRPVRRVFERGPSSRGAISVVQHHPHLEDELRRYVEKSLKRQHEKSPNRFSQIFIDRMYGR